MNCRDAQVYIATQRPNDLAPAEHAALRQHLQGCAACRDALALTQHDDDAIEQWVASAPVSGFSHTVARLQQAQQLHPARRHLRRAGWPSAITPVVIGAVVCAIAVLLLVANPRLLQIAFDASQTISSPSSPADAPGHFDAVSLVAVTPHSNTTLSGRVMLQAQVGYALASAPEAIVSVRLVGQAPTTRYFGESRVVRAGKGQVTLQFTLDAARAIQVLDSTTARLEVVVRAPNPDGSTRLLAQEVFHEVTYALTP